MKNLIKGIVIATMALSAGAAVAGEQTKAEAVSTFEQAQTLYSGK